MGVIGLRGASIDRDDGYTRLVELSKNKYAVYSHLVQVKKLLLSNNLLHITLSCLSLQIYCVLSMACVLSRVKIFLKVCICSRLRFSYGPPPCIHAL